MQFLQLLRYCSFEKLKDKDFENPIKYFVWNDSWQYKFFELNLTRNLSLDISLRQARQLLFLCYEIPKFEVGQSTNPASFNIGIIHIDIANVVIDVFSKQRFFKILSNYLQKS